MGKSINYIKGHIFEGTRFTYISESPSNGRRRVLVKCICDTIVDVQLNHICSLKTKSCGCYNKETLKKNKTIHGDSDSRLYKSVYHNMLSRCYNQNVKFYYRYGGRGIVVCDEWRTNYVNFRDWAIETGYNDTLTIERKRLNDGYSPDNCKWIPERLNQIQGDQIIQGWNTSTVNIVTVDGIEYPSIAQAARSMGLDRGTIVRRCDSPKFAEYTRKLRYE